MKSVSLLAALLVLANSSQAQPDMPGAPPSLRYVAKVDRDKRTITVVDTVTVPVQVQKIVNVNINGQAVQQVVVETTYKFEQRMWEMDLKGVRFITPDGRPVEDAWKRLKDKTVIAVSQDGNTPGLPFLRALNPDCLVVIIRAPKGSPVVPAPPKALPKT